MNAVLSIIIVALPVYSVRFGLFGFPFNVLLLLDAIILLITLCWLFATKRFRDFLRATKIDAKVFWGTLLLFCSALIGLVTFGVTEQSLGALLVLFIQPVLTFFVVRHVAQIYPQSKQAMLWTLLVLLAACGVLALVQYGTLWTLPQAYWGNAAEPKRAVAVFGHPNFYALFAAPALAFLLPFVFKSTKNHYHSVVACVLWFMGLVGLFLSLSRAGWLGLAVAAGIFGIFGAQKRIRFALLGVGVIAVALLFLNVNFRYRVLLPFKGEKSTVSRFSLWNTGKKAITESPLVGLGLTGFSVNWDRLNTDPNIDRHNYPHNIFLNFWTETGLLGLLSFVFLAALALVRGIKNRNSVFALGLALFIVTILVQGMFDNPYFKNDLAMLFWVLFAIGI